MKNLLDNTLFKWLSWFCNHRHNLLLVYSIVLVFLIAGVVADSGAQFIGFLAAYSTVFFLTYFLFETFLRKKDSVHDFLLSFISKIEMRQANRMAIILMMAIIAFMDAHFIFLGGVPTIKAWHSHNSFDIYNIRKIATTQSPAYINYPHSFILRAIIPFLLLFFYQQKNRKVFIAFFFISVFYCMAFIAKSYLVTALIPLLLYTFLRKKYFQFIAISIFIFAGLNFLVFVSNPALRGGDTNQVKVVNTLDEPGDELGRSVNGLATRTFLLPGKIVSEWFKMIPARRPFLKGNGYQFVTSIRGTEFVDYSSELYPVIFPDYAKRGYAGRVNSASFMYDYSNFGWVGIIYSAIILAMVFVFVNLIFAGNNFIKLCINLYYVLALSSSSFLTLAFSGGWGLMVLLFLFYRKDFSTENNLSLS